MSNSNLLRERRTNKKIAQIKRGEVLFRTSILDPHDNQWASTPLISWQPVMHGCIDQQCRVRVHFFKKTQWSELSLDDTAYDDWTDSKKARWVVWTLKKAAHVLNMRSQNTVAWFPGLESYLTCLTNHGFDDPGAQTARSAAMSLAESHRESETPNFAVYQFLRAVAADRVSDLVCSLGECIRHVYRNPVDHTAFYMADAIAVDELQMSMVEGALFLLLGDFLP